MILTLLISVNWWLYRVYTSFVCDLHSMLHSVTVLVAAGWPWAVIMIHVNA